MLYYIKHIVYFSGFKNKASDKIADRHYHSWKVENSDKSIAWEAFKKVCWVVW